MSTEGDNEIGVPTKRRPVGVTILGWVFIAFSGFAFLVSLFVFAMFTIMQRYAPPGSFPTSPPPNFPPGFGPLFWVFQHFQLMIGLEDGLALFSIYAAVLFLRLKPWSRTYFEFLNWLVLAYTVGFTIFWVHMWRTMATGMPNPTHGSPGPPPVLMANFGTAMGIVIGLINAAIPALLIYLLRSRFVRPAFRPQAAIRAEPSS